MLPIIVDNKSTDNSVEVFEREVDAVLIKNDENKGYAAGNNWGLKKAYKENCEFALIINPDVEIKDEYAIKKMVDAMESDKQVAVIGPNVINLQGDHQNPLRELKFWEDFLWPLAVMCYRRTGNNRYVGDYTKSGTCEKVVGCCFLVRMSAIDEIDYLDENTFLYSEEPILSARLENKGYKVLYLADVEVLHRHEESDKGNAEVRTTHYWNSRYYYLKNYKYKGLKRKLACASCKIERRIIKSK